MYCNKCGNEIKENDRFCSICGNRIAKKDEFKDPKVTKFILLVTLIIILFIIIIIIFKNNKIQNTNSLLMQEEKERTNEDYEDSYNYSSGYDDINNDNVTLEENEDNYSEFYDDVEKNHISKYDYLNECLNNNHVKNKKYQISDYNTNEIKINFEGVKGTAEISSTINFTNKMTQNRINFITATGKYAVLHCRVYFDENLNAIKITVCTDEKDKIYEEISMSEEDGGFLVELFNGMISDIYTSILLDPDRTIQLAGKTIEQIKEETIDM